MNLYAIGEHQLFRLEVREYVFDVSDAVLFFVLCGYEMTCCQHRSYDYLSHTDLEIITISEADTLKANMHFSSVNKYYVSSFRV